MEFPAAYSLEHLLESVDDSDEDIDGEGLFKCRICKKEFAKKDYLQTHQKLHNGDVFECHICKKTFATRKYLTRHVRRTHKKMTFKHKCDFCDKLFYTRKALRQHELVHTGEKPNKCETCGKCFRSGWTLKNHIYIHTGEKPYKCAFCPYACRDNSTLRKHQERHLGIVTKFKCTKCSKSFPNKKTLKVHVDEVHLSLDVMKYKCDECGKGFKFPWTLRAHKIGVHTNRLATTCEICHRSITNKHNLHAHMQTHIAYKPYKCDVEGCNMRFSAKPYYNRHRLIHFPELQYKCPKCDAGFNSTGHLNRHVRYVHGYKPPLTKDVECGECGVKFYTKAHLRMHIKCKHDMSNPLLYCDHCEFTCRWKPSLILHMKAAHIKEYFPSCFVCKICGEASDSQKSYGSHMYKHHRIRFRKKLKTRKEVKKKPHLIIKEEPIDIEEGNLEEVLDDAEVFEIPVTENAIMKDLVDIVDEDIQRYEEKQKYGTYVHVYKDVQVKKPTKRKDPFTDKKLLLRPVVLLDRSIADNYRNNNNNGNPANTTTKIHYLVKKENDRLLKLSMIEELDRLRNMYNDRVMEIIGIKKKEAESKHNNKIVLKKVKVKHDDDDHKTVINEINNDKSNINTSIDDIETTNNEINSREYNLTEISSQDKNKEIISQNKEDDSQEKSVEKYNFEISDSIDEVTKICAVDQNDDDKNVDDIRNDGDKIEVQESVDCEVIQGEQKSLIDIEGGQSNHTHNVIKENKDVNNSPYEVEVKVENIDEESDLVILSIPNENIKNKTQNTINDTGTSNSNDIIISSKETMDFTESIHENLEENVKTNKNTENTHSYNMENDTDDNIKEIIPYELKKRNPKKLKLNTAQCYVCFKLFPTKEELTEHCQTHFDVCSINKLMKCPLCPYVGRHYFDRHMKSAHNIKLNIKHSKINKNEETSVYTLQVLRQENLAEVSGYDEVSGSKVSVSQIEVIPSVKNLNRNAYMNLDKDIRERKQTNTYENVLVRKGSEWIVSKELVKIDLEKHLFPKITKAHKINCVFKFKDSNPYVEDLMKLRAQAKRENIDIIFPCNSCTKICRNIAALKAHLKSHDKTITYKKRSSRHFIKSNEKKNSKKGKNKRIKKNNKVNTKKEANNTNKNKVSGKSKKPGNLPNTKEEVIEFFNKNIGGSEQELEEFVKIFTQIDKIGQNEFSKIEHNEEFGVQ